jgi:hypothetical protein
MDTGPRSKEVFVAGCKVKLDFRRTETNQWSVGGTILCGAEENKRTTFFHTKPCATREEAEKQALGEAGALIGINTPTRDQGADT